MKIVFLSMQIILNLKSTVEISKKIQIGITFFVTYFLMYIRYLLEHFIYLKFSQISVPMITLNGYAGRCLNIELFGNKGDGTYWVNGEVEVVWDSGLVLHSEEGLVFVLEL